MANSLLAQEQKAAKAPKSAEAKTDAGDWGSLTGQIFVDGKVPVQPAEKVDTHPDKEYCKVDGKIPPDDKITVDANNGLRDVFVFLVPKKDQNVKVHSSYDKMKKTPVVLDNVNCRFVPHAVFVRPGQKMILKNSDPVGHNCHITTINNEHNLNLPANNQVELVLKKADKFPGNVVCDLHTWMDSVIFVRDNPYVAITDAQGKFKIENIPAGEYEFRFWHKKVGNLKKLSVTGKKVSRKGLVEIAITKDATVDLGAMKLPVKSFKK